MSIFVAKPGNGVSVGNPVSKKFLKTQLYRLYRLLTLQAASLALTLSQKFDKISV